MTKIPRPAQPISSDFTSSPLFDRLYKGRGRACLSTFYGSQAKFSNFADVISAANSRFDSTSILERALTAAASSPTFDMHQINKDSALFLSDPLATISTFADRSLSSRLQPSVISSPQFNSFPDIPLLLEISSSVEPIFDPGFSPSLTDAAVRPQLLPIQPAIDALFQTNYSKGEVLLVTLSSFQQVAKDFPYPLSLSNIWHTDKPNNDLGRLLYDYKNLTNGTPVNSDLCRDLYREKYGKLVYPTVSDFCQMLWNAYICFPNTPITIPKCRGLVAGDY